MVADTVPLAESRGFGRKGQRLTACGSVVALGKCQTERSDPFSHEARQPACELNETGLSQPQSHEC